MWIVQFFRNNRFEAYKFNDAGAAGRFETWVRNLSNVSRVWCGKE